MCLHYRWAAANLNTLADNLAKISAARLGRKVCEDIDGSKHHGGLIWIMLAEFQTPSAIRNKKPPRLCSVTRFKNEIWPIAALSSKILGPISRHLMAQIIPMICNAARVLCNGMFTAQRFTCKMKNKSVELDALMSGILFHTTTKCLLLYNFRHRCLDICCSSPSKRPSVSRPHHSDPL